jgi:hypothetical protein
MPEFKFTAMHESGDRILKVKLQDLSDIGGEENETLANVTQRVLFRRLSSRSST